MKKNEITPKRDIVFKRLFGTVGNEEILKSLLESILDIKIGSVELNIDREIEGRDIRGRKMF